MISGYDDLQRGVQSWLMRPDLNDVVPTFIQMCESGLNRVLRTQSMITRSRARVLDSYISLPRDWLEAWNIQVTGGRPLEYQPPASMDVIRNSADEHEKTGPPAYYSIVGTALELFPVPEPDTVDLEMVYFARIPALSEQNTSNWLLASHPDVYLYGTLIHSAPYLVDDQRLAVWQSLYNEAVTSLSNAEARARRSGGVLKRPAPKGY